MISSLKNIHLDLSILTPIFTALVIVVILFTIFIYRRTNPIISRFQKSILTILRSTSLLLLLLVVLQATLTLFFEKKNAPLLAVAIDGSASMTINDSKGSRKDQIAKILRNDLFSKLDKNFDLKYYSFANDIEKLDDGQSDSLHFIGDATNLQNTLELIKADNATENLNGILLMSDGVYTAGGNPVRTAEALGVPVHSISIGSTDPITDLAITDIDANPFCYVDQATPIRISVHNRGLSAITLPVTLQENGVQLSVTNISIPASPSDAELTINYTPKKTGRQKLIVSLPTQPAEQTAENNRRTFYIDVFKSKLNILLIAGSLSPDISFFKRLLSTDRYHVASIVQKKSGGFYQSNAMDKIKNADIFIFYDFPNNASPRNFIDELKNNLNKKKQPLLFIPGAGTSANLTEFADFLPVESYTKLPQERPVYLKLSPIGETHPVMQAAADASLTQSLWSELPPVFTSIQAEKLASDAKVLAYSRINIKSRQLSPLIVLRANSAHKSAAILAHELWRWDLMMWGINRSDDLYRNFLINLARWLETNRSENLVRVEMDNSNYKYGDAITLNISVFDENFNPVDSAAVNIQLKKVGNSRDYSAQAMGDGRYAASIQPPNPGDYEAVVSASISDQKVGEEKVLFSVGEYSAELADLTAQPAVLQGLSRATNGAFVYADSVNQLASKIHGTSAIAPITREKELWNNKFILAAILLLLTTEWFLRKRKGMV